MKQHQQDKNLAKSALIRWEIASDDVAKIFKLVYFGHEADMYWIANDIGSVVEIADYFFSVSDMTEYIKYGYSKKKMFSHYEYALKEREAGRSPVNIKNWIKMK